MKERIYIVKYSKGNYDDWIEIDLFVTKHKQTAIDYVAKFNTILEEWKDFYNKDYEDHFNGRSYILSSIHESYFTTIQTR